MSESLILGLTQSNQGQLKVNLMFHATGYTPCGRRTTAAVLHNLMALGQADSHHICITALSHITQHGSV